MSPTHQGFFVKVGDCAYRGPFESLGVARDEARVIGPDLNIYHGVLKRISEDIIDDSQLFLIPKVEE
jgi:hypothetical protein